MSNDDILSNCFCQDLLSFSSQTFRGITNFSSFYCCCLEEPLSAILAPLLREPLTHARFVGLLVLGPTSLYLHLRAFHFLPKKVHRNQIDHVTACFFSDNSNVQSITDNEDLAESGAS